ncbi:MAG: SMI1/KNR4 family protein [Planctomycetaceae bacterium]
MELISDLVSVLQINLEAADSVPEPDGLEFFWPDQFLVIGESGDGDYFCMDAGEEVTGVMQFDHQSVTFELVADSLSDFVTMLVHTFIEGGSCCDSEHCDHDHDHDHDHDMTMTMTMIAAMITIAAMTTITITTSDTGTVQKCGTGSAVKA